MAMQSDNGHFTAQNIDQHGKSIDAATKQKTTDNRYGAMTAASEFPNSNASIVGANFVLDEKNRSARFKPYRQRGDQQQRRQDQ